jgi:hypothetical protein
MPPADNPFSWRWANEQALTWTLDRLTDEDYFDELLLALGQIIIDPDDPDWVQPLRGDFHHPDRFIAALPAGWFLVFTKQWSGTPPDQGYPQLVVIAFYNIGDLPAL